MNQIWNESDIVIVNGEEYLNDSASERLYQVYQDKLNPRGRQLYKLSWAEKVCVAVPRVYEPAKKEPEPQPLEPKAQKQEVRENNEVFNLENAKKVLEDFDKAYSANPRLDLGHYLLTHIFKILDVRPIYTIDIIEFGEYICSQPKYKDKDISWSPVSLILPQFESQVEKIIEKKGLEVTFRLLLKSPANVYDMVNYLLEKGMSAAEIANVLSKFLSEKDEEFQSKVEDFLKDNIETKEIYDKLKNNKKKPNPSNGMSAVEKFIIDAYNQEAANPQMSAEQWLFSLLDLIYVSFNLKAEEVKDLIVKNVVGKEPLNIDILTLSRFVIEKDRQIKYCEQDVDVLIDDLIERINEKSPLDVSVEGLELVHYNVTLEKWEEFNSKLAARIYTDLNSSSVVDPVKYKKLYYLIIASSKISDTTLIGKLEEKFGLFKNELVAMAKEALERTRQEDPFEYRDGEEKQPLEALPKEFEDDEYSDDDEFEIVHRRKPMTKEGKKKILYASIAGVGIISTLFLTFVQGYNPVTVVAECVKTFGALLKNNATLAQLGVKLGQLSVYFASVIVSFKSFFKFADTFDESKVNNKIDKKEKRRKAEPIEEDDEEVDEATDDDYSFIDEDDIFDDLDEEDIKRVVKR